MLHPQKRVALTKRERFFRHWLIAILISKTNFMLKLITTFTNDKVKILNSTNQHYIGSDNTPETASTVLTKRMITFLCQ